MKTRSLWHPVVFSIFVSYSISFAQWTQTNGPFGGNVTSLVTDGSYLYASTGTGVYRSADNAASWLPANRGLTDVAVSGLFTHAQSLYARTNKGVFFSQDHGGNWMPMGLTNYYITDFTFTDSLLFVGTYYGLFHSGDSGLTWIGPDSALGSKTIQSLYTRGQSLFAGVGANVFKSTNQGASWIQLSLPQSYRPSAINSFGNVLLVGDDEVVYSSRDDGLTWTTGQLGELNTFVLSFAKFGTNIFAGTSGGVFLSNDSAKTWKSPTLTYYNVQALVVLNSILFAATYGGGLFESSDNAAHWTTANNGLGSMGVTGLATIGSQLYAATFGGGIYMTSDGGSTWTSVSDGLGTPFIQSVSYIDGVLFSGTLGGIYRSLPYPPKWTRVASAFPQSWVYGFSSNSDGIFAAGIGVSLSTDNGSTWQVVDSTVPGSWVFSVLCKETEILAGTNWGGVICSTDAGKTWSKRDSGLTNMTVRSLALSENNLLAGTMGGGVFISNNDGMTWSPTSLDTSGVYCLAVSNGAAFAATTAGILVSADGGENWKSTDLRLGYDFLTIAPSGQDLYVGSQAGGLWHRPMWQMTTSVEPPKINNVNTFVLSQNFPNPFNPSTLISYHLPVVSSVVLKVFDVLGRDVQTIVDRSQSAGDHSISFDASALPSGVYFFRLDALGQVQPFQRHTKTRKMILIK